MRYSLAQSAAAEYFTINQTSGDITTAQAIDRETNAILTFIVIAEDLGLQPMSSNASVMVMISDINDNAPRFVTPLSGTEFRIPENMSAVYNITNTMFHAVDDDVNNDVTYSIVGGTGLGVFDIYPTGYIYLANGTLDREVTSFYNLTIEARDDGNMSTQITGTIRVLDVNDRLPEFTLNQYTAFVFENVPAGTTIATVSAIDFDEDIDNHTVGYGFVSNDMCEISINYNDFITEDGVDFVINNVTGVITLNSGMLDADSVMPDITLCVVAYSSADRASVTDYTRVIIIPRDVNEHDPVLQGCDDHTIMETTSVGTIILSVTGTDEDQDSNLYYEIIDFASSLKIHNNGGIYLNNPINLQSISLTCGSLKCIPYIVTLYDHPNTTLPTTRHTFCSGSISVVDVDNNAPSFPRSIFDGAVYENATVGDVIKVLQDGGVGAADLDVTASDVDVGFILRYSLVNDSFTAFEFDSELNGILQVGTLPDDGLIREYSFDIIVRDTGGQNDTATVNVKVVKINRNRPTFNHTVYNFSIAEESDIGFIVRIVLASDNDSSQNEIIYQVESSNPIGSFFIINNQTGEISINNRLDREQYSEHKLVVIAVDRGSPPLTGTTTVTITLTDINDNDPEFAQRQFFGMVEENAATGHPVMDSANQQLQLLATDADTGANAEFIYQVVGTSVFAVNSTSGLVSVNRTLNFEQTNQISFQVVAVDTNDLTSRSEIVTVTVNITDDDNNPVFTMGTYMFEANENLGLNIQFASVSATDPDQILSAIQYRIDSGNDDGKFQIAELTGHLSLTGSLDREQVASYSLMVAASSNNFLTFSNAQVIVTVIDFNDNSPTFGQNYTFTITEVGPNHIVGTVEAMDSDSGSNAAIVYSLSPNGEALFNIDSSTGEITTSTRINFETHPSITFSAIAEDSGSPRLSGTTTVTVQVIDINDNHPEFAYSGMSAQ